MTTKVAKAQIKKMNEKFTKQLLFINTDTDAEQDAFSEKIYALLGKQQRILADAVPAQRYPSVEKSNKGGRK